jgi:hypothetical protein
MAGALWTSYHASFPARWVEAMKKPSRAGGKPAKARSRRRSSLKRNIEPKAVAHRNAVTEQPADWLEKLGMSEYADIFAECKIDAPVLRHVTDQYLKDIGVAPEHRRKMLAAISELPGAWRSMILWHRTRTAAARQILRAGFRDERGRYLTDREFEGVWLADCPLDENEGAYGDALLRIVLNCTEDEIRDWEWIEEGKGYREWLIPAAFINDRAQITLVELRASAE